MTRTLTLLAVVVLAITAGCLGGDTTPTTPQPTESERTPTTTTTTPTPGLEDVTLPPGVSRDRVDASTLLSTHRRALSKVSFTQQLNETLLLGGDRGRYLLHAREVKASGDRVSVVSASAEQTTRRYSNGTAAFTKLTTDDVTEYAVNTRPLERQQVIALELVEPYLASGAFSATGVTVRNGETLIRIGATGIDNATALERSLRASEIRQLNGTGLVDQQGRLRSLTAHVTYVPEGGNESITIRLNYSVSALGETTVSAPAWLSTARERATFVNVTRIEGPALAITPTKGTLATNTTLRVFLGNVTGTARLSEPVDTGETVYLSRQEGQVELTRSRPTGELGGFEAYSLLGTSEHGILVFVSQSK